MSKHSPVQDYIAKHWVTLTRTHADIHLAAVDPKCDHKEGDRWIVYVAQTDDITEVRAKLKAEMKREDFAQIAVRSLPKDWAKMKTHGLLYLPHPYVVPGGMFNEMYGWDSYFIVLGLLHDGLVELAKNMTDNLLYQIKHYGKILNANRSYYLLRSQPPLLTPMILAVYEHTKDKAWLKSTLHAVAKQYRYWTKRPHLISSVGLSRFYARSTAVPPEVESSYYEGIKEYYRTHLVKAYDVNLFYNFETDELTPKFYRGDRTVRESGFDLTNKYGPFGANITSFIPVSLNALLHLMERNIAEMHVILGNEAKQQMWLAKAQVRADTMNRYLWEPDLRYYFDYNFNTHRSRPYIYATALYPLWTGVATQTQADELVQNLPSLEAPGGIVSSAYVTGMQWDAPYGWAPHQLMAVEGLMCYGYEEAALRIARNFVDMVDRDFKKRGALYEKYDVRAGTSCVNNKIEYGYTSNEVGFGWTNGVYSKLLAILDGKQVCCPLKPAG